MPPAPPGQAAQGAGRGPPEPGMGPDRPHHDPGIPAPAPPRAAPPPRRSCRQPRARTAPPGPRRSAGRRPPARPGTTRAPRAKAIRHSWSISAWAAAKKGSPKPSATDPLTTASDRSSRTATAAMARPTSMPVRVHPLRRRQPGRLPGQRRQRRARRLRLETAPAPTDAGAAVGHDDDVTDVARVAEPAVEQPAVEHDAATHPGRHDHGDVVVVPDRGAHPALAERQRLGVVVDEGGESGQRRQARPQGKRPPPLDVQRRHLLAAGAHRAAAPGAADHEAVPRAHQGGHACDHPGQGVPQGLGVVRARRRPGSAASPGAAGCRRGRPARRPSWCRRCRRPGRDLPREDCYRDRRPDRATRHGRHGVSHHGPSGAGAGPAPVLSSRAGESGSGTSRGRR